jgi:hypothetical protein
VHSDDSDSTNVSITDEELALLGAPWAKEGMLCRKHFYEAENKRAKSKNWLDVFVVIQKGELSMFTFGEHGGGGTTAVGGGNWLVSTLMLSFKPRTNHLIRQMQIQSDPFLCFTLLLEHCRLLDIIVSVHTASR